MTDDPATVGGTMQLAQALGLEEREVVALVGAGGKTSALYRLAQELRAQGRTVIATTTTHMWPPPAAEGWPLVVEADPAARLASTVRAVAEHGRAFVAAVQDAGGKLGGIPPAQVGDLAAVAGAVLVEADGARGRWLKAPAGHEPVIPPQATLVVPVVGLQAIGRPLGPGAVHRPERLADLLQVPLGATISEETVARLLLHEHGALQGCPPQARVVPLCNQADTPGRLAAGRRIAAGLLRARGSIRRVAVGAVQAAGECECWQPSAVVVLAAGAARRFGRLKQAEQWEGRPFLARVVEAALSSLATEVFVILGCGADELVPLLAAYHTPRLQHAVNPAWKEGLAGSIRCGLGLLGACVEAAVFCPADQPLLSGREIDLLLTRRGQTGAPIVLPRFRGQPRTPALFARPLFGELAALSGEAGGRVVAAHHSDLAEYVEIDDPLPYQDVDTLADRRRLAANGDDRWRM